MHVAIIFPPTSDAVGHITNRTVIKMTDCFVKMDNTGPEAKVCAGRIRSVNFRRFDWIMSRAQPS